MCFLFGFCFLALWTCSLFGYFNYPKKKNRKKIKRQVGFMVLYIINNKPQCHAHKHNKYAHSIYTCCVLHSQISGGNVLAYPNR